MRPGRIIALVVGCLLILPAIALLFSGGALGLGYAFGRDDDGYFETTIERIETATVAVHSDQLDLSTGPGTPDWVIDRLDADVRLRIDQSTSAKDLFIGIAPQDDLDAYLSGVAHNELVDFDRDRPTYVQRSGNGVIDPSTDQDFWVAFDAGPLPLELEWEATEGTWSAVLMNADGSPGVIADVNVGAKAGFVFPAIVLLLGAGLVLAPVAVALIIAGAVGLRQVPQPVPAGEFVTPAALAVATVDEDHPVALSASLDPQLSQWKWLVKWFLAIPHFVVLFFLWIAFAVLTVVAFFAILFTGRYPRGIFDFNVGVLRWSWRVSYYATNGGLGTDRYPPFSLDRLPGDLATLDIAYPERLSRGLVLVKWWLLAIPHYVVVGLLLNGGASWTTGNGTSYSGIGLLGLLVLVAGVVLLFTGRYPQALFDLIIGLNRWIYRVVAYASLMTDKYPPFRLDQGGTEPTPEPAGPPPPRPAASTVDLGGSASVSDRLDV